MLGNQLTGFEPVTSCLQSRRSPTELQPHSFQVYKPSHTPYSISFTQIRTSPATLRTHRKIPVLVTAITAASLAIPIVAACGSDTGDSAESVPEGFQQVTDIDTIFTPDDLKTIGFKQARSYELEGLPGASAAIFGFWRIASGDPIDYEIRFYSNHEDAVELGSAPADEGSGADAHLIDTYATYKHGVKDRRMVLGTGRSGGAQSGTGPRYGNYAIYGNIAMLCGGAVGNQALDRCEELANALKESMG